MPAAGPSTPAPAAGRPAVRSLPRIRCGVVVLMGVSGSGKTTVGQALAARLATGTGRSWAFADADDYHAPEATARMARGEALSDADRAPWLARLRALVDARLAEGPPTLLACSALKAAYRDALAAGRPGVAVAWLDAPPAVFAARLAARRGHAVGPAFLPSQLATLEAPAGALRLDATRTVGEIAETAAAWVADGARP